MTTKDEIAKIEALKSEMIMSVYSGRNGKCCCGCSGKHTYSSKHVEAASKNRGYRVTPDEVNDGQVTRILHMIQAYQTEAEFYEDSFVSVVVGKRLYVAYFVPEKFRKEEKDNDSETRTKTKCP